MISTRSMFYQKPFIADRSAYCLHQLRMSKHFSQRLLTIFFRAKTQRRKGYARHFVLIFIAQRRKDAACIDPLTLLLSYSLTLLHLSRCFTSADANDSVQRTKTDQACKDKYASEDEQDNAKCSGDSASKIKDCKHHSEQDTDDPVG